MKYLYAIVNEHLLKSIRCQTVSLILPVPDFSMDILSHYENTLIPCHTPLKIATKNELVNIVVTFTPALMGLSDLHEVFFLLLILDP